MLQQRAAGEAPLREPTHVCLLIHLAPAQANTRRREEQPVRPFVLAAEQVREMHAARASYDARLPNSVSVCMTEEDDRREYTSVDSGKSIISIYSCFNSCCTHTYPSKHIYVDIGKNTGLVRLGLLYSQFLCGCVCVFVCVCK